VQRTRVRIEWALWRGSAAAPAPWSTRGHGSSSSGADGAILGGSGGRWKDFPACSSSTQAMSVVMLIRRWILARHRSETTVFVTACDRGPCPQPCHAPTASPIRHRFRTLRTLEVRESKDLRDLFVTQFWTPIAITNFLVRVRRGALS
jgi:hypothetical protein